MGIAPHGSLTGVAPWPGEENAVHDRRKGLGLKLLSPAEAARVHATATPPYGHFSRTGLCVCHVLRRVVVPAGVVEVAPRIEQTGLERARIGAAEPAGEEQVVLPEARVEVFEQRARLGQVPELEEEVMLRRQGNLLEFGCSPGRACPKSRLMRANRSRAGMQRRPQPTPSVSEKFCRS